MPMKPSFVDRLDTSLFYRGLRKDLRAAFGRVTERKIWKEASAEWDALEKQNAKLPWDRRAFILPAVALYRVIERYRPGEAKAVLSAYGTRVGQKMAHGVHGVTAVPGVSALIWKNAARITRFMSSERVGYRRSLVNGADGTVGVDILACPYYDLCRDLGAPEAAQVICAMDKAYMGGFRHIDYRRSAAVSEGAPCCDYRLRWREKDVPAMPKMSADAIQKHLATRLPVGERARAWQEIEAIYERFVSESPDIGGYANFMGKNFLGALSAFAYDEYFDRSLSEDELVSLMRDMMIGSQKPGRLRRIDLNRPALQKAAYAVMAPVVKQINRHKADGSWHNTWGIRLNPLGHREGISIHLVGCPIVDFAKAHGFEKEMPVFCRMDYLTMEHRGLRLVRNHTVAEGAEECDYWILNREGA